MCCVRQQIFALSVSELGKRKLRGYRSLRLAVQAGFAALSNGYIRGFVEGRIFTGSVKAVCVPGLNCYSCPGALGACPIGSLQSTLGSRQYKFAFYIIGFLMVVGALLGRFVCGFLCPFGLLEDLLHKIPYAKKLRRLPGEKYLRLMRYPILIMLVIILPVFAVDIVGQGSPWFCKYVCPAGTAGAGIPLVLLNEGIRAAVGFLYAWKLAILAAVAVLSVIVYRPFCRYMCPLGLIYGFFNKFAFLRFRVDRDGCTRCGACRRVCGLDIPVWRNPNSIDCIRCGECMSACPEGAITLVKLHDMKDDIRKGTIR